MCYHILFSPLRRDYYWQKASPQLEVILDDSQKLSANGKEIIHLLILVYKVGTGRFKYLLDWEIKWVNICRIWCKRVGGASDRLENISPPKGIQNWKICEHFVGGIKHFFRLPVFAPDLFVFTPDFTPVFPLIYFYLFKFFTLIFSS